MKSVKQWILSFLIIDAAFWLWVGGTCLFDSVECADTWAFGSYFFYLPWSTLLGFLPAAAFFISMILSHALLGAILGVILQKRPLHLLVKICIALVVLIGISVLFGNIERQQEIERETSTHLWKITDSTESSISYQTAQWLNRPDAPNGFELLIDDWQGTQYLENTNETVVKVLCYREGCADEEADGYVTITYAEYVEARNLCLESPLDCPYYSVGSTDLFDVTISPVGIVLMVERYVP